MLTHRIIGAFTLRRSVFAEVEHDTSFTTTAWILVAVAAFLNQLGSFGSSDLFSWLIKAIGGAIFAILGFVVGALVINWMGRIIFKADVSFDELVRTLGLAYVWRAIGVFGILAVFSEALSGALDMVEVVVVVMMVIAWLIAAKEALDLGWLQTGVAVMLGWTAQFVITTVIAGLALVLLELAGGALGELFGY